MNSQDTTQHELNTTQRELNAAIYYTWKAINEIKRALLDLKWLIHTSESGKHDNVAQKAFYEHIREISFIRDKFYKEQLRIVFESAFDAMEDKDDD